MFSLCLPLVLKDALSIILNVLCREGSGGVISLVTCDISLFKENDPVIFCILSSYVFENDPYADRIGSTGGPDRVA